MVQSRNSQLAESLLSSGEELWSKKDSNQKNKKNTSLLVLSTLSSVSPMFFSKNLTPSYSFRHFFLSISVYYTYPIRNNKNTMYCDQKTKNPKKKSGGRKDKRTEGKRKRKEGKEREERAREENRREKKWGEREVKKKKKISWGRSLMKNHSIEWDPLQSSCSDCRSF